MNIIEAIKSGKPFKRKHWGKYFIIINDLIVTETENREQVHERLQPYSENLLADDWEIQEKTITMTESQFDEAWEKFLENTLGEGREANLEAIKKELGF